MLVSRLLPSLIVAFYCAAVVVPSAKVDGQDANPISINVDHENAIYESGETATFRIAVPQSLEIAENSIVSFVVDDFIGNQHDGLTFPKGEIALGKESSFTVRLQEPGFLRCQVSYTKPNGKKGTTALGIGFSPTEIPPSMPAPADFDEYWDGLEAELAKVAMNPKLEPVENRDPAISAFDIKVNCWGSAPVSGYLAKPADAQPKTLPAILWVHGAGVRSSNLGNAVLGAKSGMLSLDINAHGLENGKSANYYTQQKDGPLRGYRTRGNDSRDTIYFRDMFVRLIRAIDFLTAQPEWDGQHVIVIGHSQGGGQALAAGGLDSRVTFVAAGVPAICDHSGRLVGRINGWPKLVPLGQNGQPNPLALQASAYFDAVNFAARCKADAVMSVGFIDATCPPSSCYAAFNQLKGNKEILTYPSMGHGSPQPIKDEFFKRVLKHIGNE